MLVFAISHWVSESSGFRNSTQPLSQNNISYSASDDGAFSVVSLSSTDISRAPTGRVQVGYDAESAAIVSLEHDFLVSFGDRFVLCYAARYPK